MPGFLSTVDTGVDNSIFGRVIDTVSAGIEAYKQIVPIWTGDEASKQTESRIKNPTHQGVNELRVTGNNTSGYPIPDANYKWVLLALGLAFVAILVVK